VRLPGALRDKLATYFALRGKLATYFVLRDKLATYFALRGKLATYFVLRDKLATYFVLRDKLATYFTLRGHGGFLHGASPCSRDSVSRRKNHSMKPLPRVGIDVSLADCISVQKSAALRG